MIVRGVTMAQRSTRHTPKVRATIMYGTFSTRSRRQVIQHLNAVTTPSPPPQRLSPFPSLPHHHHHTAQYHHIYHSNTLKPQQLHHKPCTSNHSNAIKPQPHHKITTTMCQSFTSPPQHPQTTTAPPQASSKQTFHHTQIIISTSQQDHHHSDNPPHHHINIVKPPQLRHESFPSSLPPQ